MLSDNPLRNRLAAAGAEASFFVRRHLDTGDKGPTYARDFRWRSCLGRRRCLIFSPRMFLVHLRWRLRMSFSVAFGAKSEEERGEDEGDDPFFFGRESEAIAQGLKSRAPNSFQLFR
jgi:hypothetical protein